MPLQRYCLDANVLIVAWQTYYAPDICPSYWDMLDKLGERDIIFIPDEVYRELSIAQDILFDWVKSSKIKTEKIDASVTRCLQEIFTSNPIHERLVDSKNNRSLADPWVIAHAMKEGACVVTKEVKVPPNSNKAVKIPNVCENMGIRCINDFEFTKEMKFRFSCSF